jgi:hypothetical protein
MAKPEAETGRNEPDYQVLFDNAVKATHLTPDDGVFTYTLSGSSENLNDSTVAAVIAIYHSQNPEKSLLNNNVFLTVDDEYELNPSLLTKIPSPEVILPKAGNEIHDDRQISELGSKFTIKNMPTVMLVFHTDIDSRQIAVTLHTIKGIPPAEAYWIARKSIADKCWIDPYNKPAYEDPNQLPLVASDLINEENYFTEPGKTSQEIERLCLFEKKGFRRFWLEGTDKNSGEYRTVYTFGLYPRSDGEFFDHIPFGMHHDTSLIRMYETITDLSLPNSLDITGSEDDPDLQCRFYDSKKPQNTPAFALTVRINEKTRQRQVIMSAPVGFSALTAFDMIQSQAQKKLENLYRISN